MREQYYTLLQENNFVDFLSEIEDLSNSRKIRILEKLKENYSNETINLSLLEYKCSYIDVGRINLRYIEKILDGLAKKYNKIKRLN